MVILRPIIRLRRRSWFRKLQLPSALYRSSIKGPHQLTPTVKATGSALSSAPSNPHVSLLWIDSPPSTCENLVDASALLLIDTVRVAHVECMRGRRLRLLSTVKKQLPSVLTSIMILYDVLAVLDVARQEVLPYHSAAEGVDCGDEDCVAHAGVEAAG